MLQPINGYANSTAQQFAVCAFMYRNLDLKCRFRRAAPASITEMYNECPLRGPAGASGCLIAAMLLMQVLVETPFRLLLELLYLVTPELTVVMTASHTNKL